jgi:hypothetical protein
MFGAIGETDDVLSRNLGVYDWCFGVGSEGLGYAVRGYVAGLSRVLRQRNPGKARQAIVSSFSVLGP